MRVVDAAGLGTCLLAPREDSIASLYEPDKEVLCYAEPKEAIEKLRWLLGHPRDRETIGKAAQARTLRDHTYARRAEHLDEIIRSTWGA
jgi:spore maturation protein CgeB